MSIYLTRFKALIIFVALCGLMLSLSACGKDEKYAGDEAVDVVLITDYGTINDGSYNQGAWEGIRRYANDTGADIAYYQPEDTDIESFIEQIDRGVNNGAGIIICPGYSFEEVVFVAQSKYPDTKFILLDGKPHNIDGSDDTIGNNVESILFAEEAAGFLAGYSAVRDGYRGLGFMGGVPEDAVIRYGYGFVQGADYAAIEMGVEVHIRYAYMNTYSEEPMVETMAAAWYDDDTEVIFACGGQMGRSVVRAAEKHDGKVIGVDIDQSSESQTIITSAEKSLSDAIYRSLMDYHNGAFSGGYSKVLSAKDSGVCLPMETSRFEKFSQKDYNSIFSRLSDGSIIPYNGTDIGTTQELTLVNTSVTYIVVNQ